MKWFFGLLVFAFSLDSFSLDLDGQLDLVKQVYTLQGKSCGEQSVFTGKEADIGELLFDSKNLSGGEDISCRTCHLDKFDSADGLPLAIGVGGNGEGVERYNNGGALVQRNTFSLKGRGHKLFKVFFWDGKAQLDNGKIITQFGSTVAGFKTALAAAAILPLVERDEFIGVNKIFDSNAVQAEVGDKLYFARYQAVGKAIRNRLHTSNDKSSKELRKAIQEIGLDVNQIELVDIGNLLAAFISREFKCEESAWDRYLNGDKNALSNKQKHGAILFFGKGRCASCHEGELLSDFSFHSIGVPQGLFGPHSRHRDIGRAGVTNRREDLFKFRTPPLLGVSNTSPYGHNGAFTTLQEVITHHYNPIEFYLNHEDYYSADYYKIGKLMGTRDRLLESIQINSDEDVDDLIDFLNAL